MKITIAGAGRVGQQLMAQMIAGRLEVFGVLIFLTSMLYRRK